ncbi:MAG: DUF6069 family protein [Acidimicrobiia bacterium]
MRGQRLIAVVAAVAASLATFAVIEGVLGVDLQSPGFGPSGPQDLGFVPVVVASALAGAAAWALLALLERWTTRSRRYWTISVTLGLVISIGGPMSGTGISQSERWLLFLLHVAVAVVLIPLLYRTARSGSDRSTI